MPEEEKKCKSILSKIFTIKIYLNIEVEDDEEEEVEE